MEERDRVDAPTNICSRPVAVTGRKYLRPRPVDANQLCYFISLLDPWLLLAGDISAIARLILFFYFLTQLWLLLAGDLSVLARLILLFYLTQPVAVTGQRRLHHRPVDANQLCYFIFLLDPWMLLAGGNSVLARLICHFILF